MRAASCLFLAPLLLGAALAGQSPPKGFTEVPKEKLERLKLVLPDANCVLTAPGADWKWFGADASPGKKYLCMNAKTGQGYAVSIGSLDHEIDAHTREQVQASLRQAVAASGAKIGNERFEPAQAPLPGKSWRLYFEQTFKEGLKIGSVVYLVQTAEHVLVTLQDSTVAGAESPTFSQFVKKLSLLK